VSPGGNAYDTPLDLVLLAQQCPFCEKELGQRTTDIAKS
jgi:hypothetical protein